MGELYQKASKDKGLAQDYLYVKNSPYEMAFGESDISGSYFVSFLNERRKYIGGYDAPSFYRNKDGIISVPVNHFVNAIKEAAEAIKTNIKNERDLSNISKFNEKLAEKNQAFIGTIKDLYNLTATQKTYEKNKTLKEEMDALQKRISELNVYRKEKFERENPNKSFQNPPDPIYY